MSLEGHNHYTGERILYKVLANGWGNTSNQLPHHRTTFLTMISDVIVLNFHNLRLSIFNFLTTWLQLFSQSSPDLSIKT